MTRPPLRIEELKIRSFRGIAALDLEFPPNDDGEGGLTVLLGDNGCGKTAIMEAILLVLGKLELLPADSAPIMEQVKWGATDFSIEANVCVRGEERQTLQFKTSELRHVIGRDDDVLHLPPLEKSIALDANVQYFSARREPEALGETPSPQGARSERESRRLAELKRKLISAYYRSLRSKKRLDTEIPVFERLQRFIRPFLGDDWTIDVLPTDNDPGSGDEVILRRGEVPSDITSLAMARNEALLRDDIPPLVPIDRLSSGQIALFAFAGPLVFRDAPADVVLIDEPEQHLHVQWQRYIIPALRELSPESQFIVATHSLDVADAASHDERLLLLPEGDPRLSRSKKDLAAE